MKFRCIYTVHVLAYFASLLIMQTTKTKQYLSQHKID